MLAVPVHLNFTDPPALRLVVDRADAGTEMLLPVADTRNVTVQTYRKLTWGGRTGLLLEAA